MEYPSHEPGHGNRKKICLLAAEIAELILSLFLLFIPFCSYELQSFFASGDKNHPMRPVAALSDSPDRIVCTVVFLALFFAICYQLFLFIRSLHLFSGDGNAFAEAASRSVYSGIFLTGGHFLASIVFCMIRNAESASFHAASPIPFLLSVAIAVTAAFLHKNEEAPAVDRKSGHTACAARREMFVYCLLVSAFTVFAALSDILNVKIIDPAGLPDIRVNGWEIFQTYNSLSADFQLIAFILFAILTVTISLLIASFITFISRSRFFYPVTLAGLLGGAFCSMIIGLYAKYYEIVQLSNREMLLSFLARYAETSGINPTYRVTGVSFYWFCAVMVIEAVFLIRKPYSRGLAATAVPAVAVPLSAPAPVPSSSLSPAPAESTSNSASAAATNGSVRQSAEVLPSDPCAAFTELDRSIPRLRREAGNRQSFSFAEPTLPALVRFVVDYARDSRLHLSYTEEDIADFIAGLGASRLTVLQGMSGTGKTSLPKIFTEALMGDCEIVEVESSWNDRNELLGYYNEFSSTYTPKKFTQALYHARLNSEQLTFVVLDEMNLSRVEYYFSDFLSLMEAEPGKRRVRLVNTALFRTENGEKTPYLGLNEGHTIDIPDNIWFIGTANRDESTFEISDKVYDRAHTMNFNKRAPRVVSHGEPLVPRYLSAAALTRLLDDAAGAMNFDVDTCPAIKGAEALLAPYNISFGNRIAGQMATYVGIYCACFAPSEKVLHDAVEKILLSKVVSKLELKSLENKEQLAFEFRKLGLEKCSEFILKLNED